MPIDLFGFLSPSAARREDAATAAAHDAGVSDAQVATAKLIADRKSAGKSERDIAIEIAARTAREHGASPEESAAISAFADASTARPHTLHPCPIADRWFDASAQLGKSYNVPLPSAKDWDKYTCREKNQIMAGSAFPGIGAAVGIAIVQVERAAAPLADAAKGAAAAAKKIFHF